MQSFFYRITDGIRVTVRPTYLEEQSDPDGQHFVFSYAVRIENVSDALVRLISRHWLIHDEVGVDTEVIGEGVIGEQPLLTPGKVHEYESFCILKSGEGYMVGEYTFKGPDGRHFQVQIPKFTLSSSQGR